MRRHPTLPRLSQHVSRAYVWLLNRARFPGSAAYWNERYRRGGASGSGSSGRLRTFKQKILNAFVAEHNIRSVIEFGCGDGSQLELASYPRYVGLDVSPEAVRRCIQSYARDQTKSFFVYDTLAFHDPLRVVSAELTLSLDVLYHLVEQQIFERYLTHLFAAADRFVVIYASDFDQAQHYHERHRAFTDWVVRHQPGWRLVRRVPNAFPYDPQQPGETSRSDFYIYGRT